MAGSIYNASLLNDDQYNDATAIVPSAVGVQIEIGGVDKTGVIDWRSFVLTQVLTSQVDQLRFSLKRTENVTYRPSILDDVIVYQDGIKIFGGKIIDLQERIDGRLETIDVLCKDHTHEMDSAVVVKVYESTTIDAIISDLISTFLPAGFSANVSVTAPVSYIAFNYEQPSKVLQQLAELVGADWYIDPDKVIQFFYKENNTAPFNLTDTSQNYEWNSLMVKKDARNIRNVIFVRGGTFKGTTDSEKLDADGTALIYKQGLRYSSVTVKVASVSQTVGVDNIDDPTAFDCLYNFQEKFVRFKAGTIPSLGDEIEVGGEPHIPVIIKVKDNVSVAEFGEYEHKIIDRSINSKEGARERAKAEIISWAQEQDEASFGTLKSGLLPGQLINIQSTIRDIDEDFVINRVRWTMRSPTSLRFDVQLVSERTFGGVEFLQSLLIRKDKEIVIDPDEVLDKIEAAVEQIKFKEVVKVNFNKIAKTEGITMGEVVTPQALDYPAVFVLAPFPTPTGFKRELALSGGVLS